MTLFAVRVTLLSPRVTLRVTPPAHSWRCGISHTLPSAASARTAADLVGSRASRRLGRSGATPAHWLVDCCGRHLRVVFPGRRWGGPGPDFRGRGAGRGGRHAGARRRRGARAGQQLGRPPPRAGPGVRAGGAARGPGGRRAGAGRRGRHVPTVALEPRRAGAAARARAPAPCVRAAPAVLAIVEAAGRERFRARAARFEGDLAAVEADQVVWRGVCEALGFQRNTRAVRAAGRGGALVAGSAGGGRPRAGRPGRAAAGHGRAAGRGHAARGPRLAGAAAQRWACARRCSARAGTDASCARPTRRRRAAAAWPSWRRAGRCAAGVAAGRPSRCCEAVRRSGRQRGAAACGGWRGASPWIGRGRAQVIAVNVLLPFAAAAGVAEAAGAVRALARPSRQSRRALHGRSSWAGRRCASAGACHQQGLLHLFKLTCAARVCERCPARGAARRRAQQAEVVEPSYD